MQSLFQSPDNRPRDKFLSRLFGIFSEEIVICWTKDNQSPYKDLDRPTVKLAGEQRGCTLDFTLESKSDGQAYITEMKCELEYLDYQFLTLKSPKDLEHHSNRAFQRFLDAAENPSQYTTTVHGKPKLISGSILVWGRCTEQGRSSVIATYGLHDVLSLEAIIADLIAWQNNDFVKLLDEYQQWTDYLFSGLRKIERPIGA